MSKTRSANVANMLKAVGHPVRLAIVNELSKRRYSCCGEVCDCFSLSQSTVSQHLAVLSDAGILEHERCGNRSHYRLNPEAIRQMRDGLEAVLVAAEKEMHPHG